MGRVGDRLEGAGGGALEGRCEAGGVGRVAVDVVEDVGEVERGEDVLLHVGAELHVGDAFDLGGAD